MVLVNVFISAVCFIATLILQQKLSAIILNVAFDQNCA